MKPLVITDEILKVILHVWREEGRASYPPDIRDVLVKRGISVSEATVRDRLRHLAAEGKIEKLKEPNPVGNRSLRVVWRPVAPPTPGELFKVLGI